MAALFIEMSKYIMKEEHRDKYEDIVTLYRADSFNTLTIDEQHFKNYSDGFVEGSDFDDIFIKDNIRFFEYLFKENKECYMNILNSGERILLGYIKTNSNDKLDPSKKYYKKEIVLDKKGKITVRDFKSHNRDYIINKILN